MKKFLPYIALLSANIIWGMTFVAGKLALKEFPVMSLSFIRFALVTILILPFFLTEKRASKIKLVHLPKLFTIGLTLVTFNIALGYQGLSYTTAIDASVLTLLLPGLSILGGWWFLREKIYWVNLVGIFIGLIGALFVIGLPLIFIGSLSPNVLLGNILIILSDVSFVIGSVLSKQMLKIYSNLTITTIIFITGAVTFALPALADYIQNPLWITKITIVGIVALLFLVFFSSICAYFLYQWGLEKVTLMKANLFQYIEPLIVAALAVPILGERISYSFLVGGIMVALGVYWGTLGKSEIHHYHHRSHRI